VEENWQRDGARAAKKNQVELAWTHVEKK